MPPIAPAALCYLAAVNVLALALTVSDKRRAKKRRWRIPEKALWLAAALGGSPAMYLSMRCIRHKTQHKTFMIGLPLLILAQAALAAVCIRRFC